MLCDLSLEIKIRLTEQYIDLIIYWRNNMQAIELYKGDKYHLKQRKKIEMLSLLN